MPIRTVNTPQYTEHDGAHSLDLPLCVGDGDDEFSCWGPRCELSGRRVCRGALVMGSSTSEFSDSSTYNNKLLNNE